MKDLKPNPITSQWASGSTNRIDVDRMTRESGILYKGPVVSNQLNGMAYDIYSSVMFNQFAGGVYSDSLVYNEGQYCTIYWKSNASTVGKFLKCICIAKGEDGIMAMPPIKNASVTTLNGIDTYNGGELDKNNWAFFEEYPFKTERFSVPFKASKANEFSMYNLFSLDTYIPLTDEEFETAPLTKVIEGKFNCFVTKTTVDQSNTAYYSFPMTFKAVYTLINVSSPSALKGYSLATNTLFAIEVEYGNIYSVFSADSFIPLPPPGKAMRWPALYYGLPFGLAFQIAPSAGKVSFNVISCGLDTLMMDGTTNASINPSKVPFSAPRETINFPVRAWGGTPCIQQLGLAAPKIVGTSIDRHASPYRGQLSLSGIRGFLNTDDLPIEDETNFYGKLLRTVFLSPSQYMREFLSVLVDQFPKIGRAHV